MLHHNATLHPTESTTKRKGQNRDPGNVKRAYSLIWTPRVKSDSTVVQPNRRAARKAIPYKITPRAYIRKTCLQGSRKDRSQYESDSDIANKALPAILLDFIHTLEVCGFAAEHCAVSTWSRYWAGLGACCWVVRRGREGAWVYISANVRDTDECVKTGLDQVNRWSGNDHVKHFM